MQGWVFQRCDIHYTMWCINTIKLNVWHAFICCKSPEGNHGTHFRCWQQFSELWAHSSWVGDCYQALWYSKGELLLVSHAQQLSTSFSHCSFTSPMLFCLSNFVLSFVWPFPLCFGSLIRQFVWSHREPPVVKNWCASWPGGLLVACHVASTCFRECR